MSRLICGPIGAPPYAVATFRPLMAASGSSCSATWAASSRVGTRTSTAGAPSLGWIRSISGNPNASVLPDPVGDLASTSPPRSASGMTADWMLKGAMMSRAESSCATSALTPSAAKD